MKKIFILILCIALCGCLPACKESVSYVQPVTFYYLSTNLSYDAQCNAIVGEVREGADFQTGFDTLAAFLDGPLGENLTNPFPAGLELVGIELFRDTLYLTFNDEISRLTGLDLTIACCCIAKTCFGLIEADSVSISAENALLDGEKAIVLRQEDILLLDTTE